MLNDESNSIAIISNICVNNKTSNRNKILEYEEIAKQLPQVDIPVLHHIHGGMYGREITIPAGTVITGQLYKFDHFDIMIEGDITVSTDTGERKRLTGFNIFKGMMGKKRAGYAHKDTRWITFHAFEGDSGEEIQSYITSETFEDMKNFHTDVNRADYFNFVEQSGMTESEIREQVENKNDMSEQVSDSCYVGASQIEGNGLFACKQLLIGDLICMARIGDKRTLAGRFSNHALFANAEIKVNSLGAELIAIRDIEENEEITVNYRDVIQNRFDQGDLCLE
jgi:hypothetical protein